MLQNARVAAFSMCELLRLNQQETEVKLPPPPPRLGLTTLYVITCLAVSCDDVFNFFHHLITGIGLHGFTDRVYLNVFLSH